MRRSRSSACPPSESSYGRSDAKPGSTVKLMPSFARHKKPSGRPALKRRFWLALLGLSLMSLPSCATAPSNGYCPVPMWPDKCTVAWLAATETPPCVDNWLDRMTRQQESIEANCR